MASVPSNPVDVPPFQIQRLISDVGMLSNLVNRAYNNQGSSGGQFEVLCAQAFGASLGRTTHFPFTYTFTHTLGSEIYVGCSNGELIRFALQADDPNKVNII